MWISFKDLVLACCNVSCIYVTLKISIFILLFCYKFNLFLTSNFCQKKEAVFFIKERKSLFILKVKVSRDRGTSIS